MLPLNVTDDFQFYTLFYVSCYFLSNLVIQSVTCVLTFSSYTCHVPLFPASTLRFSLTIKLLRKVFNLVYPLLATMSFVTLAA